MPPQDSRSGTHTLLHAPVVRDMPCSNRIVLVDVGAAFGWHFPLTSYDLLGPLSSCLWRTNITYKRFSLKTNANGPPKKLARSEKGFPCVADKRRTCTSLSTDFPTKSRPGLLKTDLKWRST
jgi:hypothetical protein